jgi:ParB-like chromosome segregation protein Spo0J
MIIETADDYRRYRRESVAIKSSSLAIDIPIPCIETMLVNRRLVVANTYNPNSVPPDKMELLKTSIIENGFCFPVVTIWSDEADQFVIIDGFHRHLIAGPDWLDMSHIPVVCLPHTMAKRMAATVQFNNARGFHQVDLDADVVRALIQQGMSEEEVAEKLGLDLDSVHRYKQLTGIASLFANVQYSTAWEMIDADTE